MTRTEAQLLRCCFIKNQKLLILVVPVLNDCWVLLLMVMPYLLWLTVCLPMLDTFPLETCQMVNETWKILL